MLKRKKNSEKTGSGRNRWGRKGSPEHQEEVERQAEILRESGNYNQINKEYLINTPEGIRRYRLVDLAGLSHGVLSRIIEVGVADEDGNPPKYTQEAMEDVEKATGIRALFIAYKRRKKK